MIYTGSHNAWKDNDTIPKFAISGNRGRDAGYRGAYYSSLAPKKSFWEIWHNVNGLVPEIENNKYYIQEYWRQVLSKLDPEKVYKDLDNSVLLCYEQHDKFCHRHIVAAWLELTLRTTVPEAVCKGSRIKVVSRPEYIKNYLKEVMTLYSEENQEA